MDRPSSWIVSTVPRTGVDGELQDPPVLSRAVLAGEGLVEVAGLAGFEDGAVVLLELLAGLGAPGLGAGLADELAGAEVEGGAAVIPLLRAHGADDGDVLHLLRELRQVLADGDPRDVRRLPARRVYRPMKV
jgi:hypothetical protein